MQTLETGKPTIGQLDVIQSTWNTIRAQLEAEKARVYEALVNYPSPIAACDQQFNYLLEERTRISWELDRLNEAIGAGLTAEDSLKRIDEFIQSSGYVDAETGQTIRSSLQGVLSRL
jgi:hypothetical protein